MRNLRLDHIVINKFSKLKRYTKVSNYLKPQKLFHKYDYSSFFISFKSEQVFTSKAFFLNLQSMLLLTKYVYYC